MNSVYIDSAVANSPIYIGPTNANSVIVGNANCTTNLVGPINIGRTTPNTVNIGKEGASTNIFGYTNLGIATNGTKNTFVEVGTGPGVALFDFHSSGLFETDNDSRIMATGGTSDGGQGSLKLFAKTISITSPLTLGSAPTEDTQIGYTYFITKPNDSGIVNTSVANLLAQTITTGGVYYACYSISIKNTGTITTSLCQAWIQNNAGGQYYACSSNAASQTIGSETTNWAALNGSAIMTIASGASIGLKYLIAGENNKTTNASYLSFTRIA